MGLVGVSVEIRDISSSRARLTPVNTAHLDSSSWLA